jgi:glutamate-1-semialdehyde 2,1-aminomutase
MYSLFFTDQPVTDFESAKQADTGLFGKYFQAMLQRGVYLAPSQFESLFLSTALTDELIDKILEAHRESMIEIHKKQ